jgi:uncharacterized membrane protein YeiB
MNQRIIGFDLARAYAILGMFIVNFNMIFGSYNDKSVVGQFISLFSGNSSTVFVILAGMGIAFMTNRSEYTVVEKNKLRHTILKRAAFLFIMGLLLSIVWPADILHFYGCYMVIISFLVFLEKKYLLLLAFLSVLIFHVLVFIVPYETGWNLDKFQYIDFYTIYGFIRNTFYNGWNSIFPWIGYFLFGMYLGRLNWTDIKIQRKMFLIGLTLYLAITLIQFISQQFSISEELKLFINADYLPPFLPFILGTSGFSLMIISGFMYLGDKVGENKLAKSFASTGQMTLTHYVSHILIGMLLFLILNNNKSELVIQPVKPIYILLFSMTYFVLSYYFSKQWVLYFKTGPLETLMRKVSD